MRTKEEILKDIKRCLYMDDCAGCDYETNHPDDCFRLLYNELEEFLNENALQALKEGGKNE